MLVWLTLIIAVLGGLFLFISGLEDAGTAVPAGVLVAVVLSLLAGLYMAAHRQRWQGARGALVGGGAAVALALAGLFWWFGGAALDSIKSPEPAAQDALRGAGAVSVLLRRDGRGAFVGQGRINSAAADFLIDTGSADVMIRHSDAERAGIDVAGLTFTTPVRTANGTVYAAPVRLRSVEIGLLRIEDLEALVARPGTLNENLLGMSFLRRLTSYTLKGDFLTLRQ